jgi:hypothetical protein
LILIRVRLDGPNLRVTIDVNGRQLEFEAIPNVPFELDATGPSIRFFDGYAMAMVHSIRLRLFIFAISGVKPDNIPLRSAVTQAILDLIWKGRDPLLGSQFFPYVNVVARALSTFEGDFVRGIYLLLLLYAGRADQLPDELKEDKILRAVQFWESRVVRLPPQQHQFESLSMGSWLRLAANFVPVPLTREHLTKAILSDLSSKIADIWPYLDPRVIGSESMRPRREWLFGLLSDQVILREITPSVPIQFICLLPSKAPEVIVEKGFIWNSKKTIPGWSVWDWFFNETDSARTVLPALEHFRSLAGDVVDGVLVEPGMEELLWDEELRFLGEDAVVRRPCGCIVHFGGPGVDSVLG